MPKGGLDWTEVSSDHFSSGVKKEPEFSRIVLRFFEGKSLLASDLDTGKSDPVCFVWLGGKDEPQPPWEKIDDLNALENRVVMTKVCPATCDPKWNQDLTFPIEVDDISHLSSMKFVIRCRDEDLDESDKASFDELGMVEMNLEDVINESKGLQSSIVKNPAWYTLLKAPGMKRVDGQIKIGVSVLFASNDIPKINQQLAAEIKDSPPNTQLGKLILKKLNTKKFENSVAKSTTSLLSTSGGRPSSASSVNKKKRPVQNRPTTAPMLKTSSIMSGTSDSFFEESDQILDHHNNHTTNTNIHPELSVVKEEGDDDLVSEPGYDKVISQIQQHGKKMEQIMDQPIILEEREEDLEEEELHILPNVNNPPTQVNQPVNQPPGQTPLQPSAGPTPRSNSQSILPLLQPVSQPISNPPAPVTLQTVQTVPQPRTTGEANMFGGFTPSKDEVEAQEDANHPEGDLPAIEHKQIEQGDPKHEDLVDHLPVGDQNAFQEFVKVGVDVLANAVTSIDMDGLDDHILQVGKAAGSVMKKGISQTKTKMVQSTAGTGVALRNYRDHIMNGIEKVQDKLNYFNVDGAQNKNNGTRQSQADIFAHGPLIGDQLENLPEGEYYNPEIMGEQQQMVRRNPSQQQLYQDPMQVSEDAFQGNATSVVRILKELHAQRQFMQNTVILLAKANEKGFKHLSGRISKMEKNLTLLNENIKIDGNDELDDFGFPLIGDQSAPPKYEEGQRVEVNYRGSGKYFVGKIARYCGDGTYDIEFDDGDQEMKVVEDSIRPSGGSEPGDETTRKTKLSKTVPARSRSSRKANALSKTTPVPASEKAPKKDYSGFKKFMKEAKKQKTAPSSGAAEGEEDFLVTRKPAAKEPEIEFVYKGANGEKSVAKVAHGPVDFARQEVNEPPLTDNALIQGPPVADQALPDSPNLRTSNPRHNPRYFSANHSSVQNSFSNGAHKSNAGGPLSPSRSALNQDFCEILDRGTIDDVAHLLESSGTLPEQLSISTRNRVYDIISTLLQQGRNIERCLAWTLALIRGKQNLLRELTIHTQKDLLESLKKISREPSKRGMLAHLLISQINRQISA